MNKTKNDIDNKYIRSRYIDIVVVFLFLIILFVLFGIFLFEYMDFFALVFIIVVPLYHFLGDKLFVNQSIGKKIMGIKIISTTKCQIPTLKMIINRRWLEWKNYDGSILSKKKSDIDTLTNTVIVSSKNRNG